MVTPLSPQDLLLETERLRLRPLSLQDQDIAEQLLTNPDVVQYVCDLLTPEEIADGLPVESKRGAGGRLGIWVVSLKDSGEKIGTSILLPLPVEEEDTDFSLLVPERFPDAEIEVGYLLRPEHWGRGFATEACSRLVRFWFEQTDKPELKATVDPENLASFNVLKKCGFTHEGLRRAYATQCAGFRLTRQEWLAVQSGQPDLKG
ncbi:GNAT family N-acetyltransferase [Rhodovibrionaceae bacterium A322]